QHTRFKCDWSSDVCSSDLSQALALDRAGLAAETLPGRQGRQPDAIGQSYMDDARAQEEQRCRRVPGAENPFALSILPDGRQRGELIALALREAGEQWLLRKLRGFEEVDRAAMTIDDLILGPFDRRIEQIEIAHRSE